MYKFKIHFPSQEKEAAYRVHYLQADKNLARMIILVISAASILFISSDILFTASTADLIPLIRIRLIFAAWSIAVIFLLKNTDSSKTFDVLSSAWLFSLIGFMTFIYSTRPVDNLNNTLTSCLIVFLFYVLYPARLTIQILCGMALSLANIIHVGIYKDLLQMNAINSILTSYLVFNILGVFIAVRWHKSRRREFTTHLKSISMRKKLEELAFTDDLTGLANRRSCFKKMVSEYHRHERYNNDLSIMIIDIDFFKKVNDNYGHDQGDKVLKVVANLLKNSCRSDDTAGRLGGEEFTILLPETRLLDAHQLADRVRERCIGLSIPTDDQEIKITISIGVAQANDHDTCAKDMLKRADVALYKAKDAGRNCVIDG